MALKFQGVRLPRKRGPFGFVVKISIAVVLGLSFFVVWSVLTSPASSAVSSRRDNFDDIESDPTPFRTAGATARIKPPPPPPPPPPPVEDINRSKNKTEALVRKEEEREEEAVESEGGDNDPDIEDGVEVNPEVNAEDEDGEEQKKGKKKKKRKILGPLFDPSAEYDWKLCAGSNKQNFVPCIDMEGGGARRHHERSCPRHPLTCLVPLPQEYRTPVVPWPESRSKVDALLICSSWFFFFFFNMWNW